MASVIAVFFLVASMLVLLVLVLLVPVPLITA